MKSPRNTPRQAASDQAVADNDESNTTDRVCYGPSHVGPDETWKARKRGGKHFDGRMLVHDGKRKTVDYIPNTWHGLFICPSVSVIF